MQLRKRITGKLSQAGERSEDERERERERERVREREKVKERERGAKFFKRRKCINFASV